MQLTLSLGVLSLLSLVASEFALLDYNKTLPANFTPLDASSGGEEVRVAYADHKLWHASACRGAKLLLGMTLNEDQAVKHVTPVNSPWDGTLEEELKTWGYKDVSDARTDDCDFKNMNRLKPAFDALGIDTRDANEGGPNHCFTVIHRDGPAIERDQLGNIPTLSSQYYTVNERKYRVTNGYFTIGVNEQEGIIFFLNRASPDQQASILWNRDTNNPARKDELPALRSSSDIAWGFWNRRSGQDLGFIRGFMSVGIMNQDTTDIIDRALANAGIGKVPIWPGVRFDSGSNEYLAMMGSPNGLAAGYFLTQHKKQLGGNKYVAFIIVFREDMMGFPTLLFSVDWAPNPPPPPPPEEIGPEYPGTPEEDSETPKAPGSGAIGHGETRLRGDTRGMVLRRSQDGRHLVREHVIWAE